MDYVIIGNSAAAIGCIEGIRQYDRNGKITIISKEPYHTYSRPLISYLLYGKTDEQRMKYRPDSFYKDMDCQTILGRTAVKIEKDKKYVLLDDGQMIRYDKLLVATGSRPFIPPIKGLDEVKNKFTFMTLDDAKNLEKAITSSSRVLIIGAGLIGLKCAEGIRDKVKSITIIDLADRILPSILDDEPSKIVKAHLERQGLAFILSDSVKSFDSGRAILTGGREIEFDILIIAVGVRPNVELIKEIGGKINRGIITDEHCQTSIPDIYAAGDCTESYDITTLESRILALLPNAYMQGECAGINMAGGRKAYDKAIPMNAIGLFGLHIITAGSASGQEYVEKTNESYKKLIVKDGLLNGYILIGDVARAGIYTFLIKEQIPLDTIDFELIKQKPQLMAFSKAYRAQKLGGVKS